MISSMHKPAPVTRDQKKNTSASVPENTLGHDVDRVTYFDCMLETVLKHLG